jgi:hypothetical protein
MYAAPDASDVVPDMPVNVTRVPPRPRARPTAPVILLDTAVHERSDDHSKPRTAP